MGHTTFSKYRVEYLTNHNIIHCRRFKMPPIWEIAKWTGKQPNEKGLNEFVAALNQSFMPGGVNNDNKDLAIMKARLILQSNNSVVAEYNAPLFEVI